MLNNYDKVKNELKLPAMKSVTIHVSEKSVSDVNDLLSHIQTWHDMSGWICFQSGIQSLPTDALRDDLGFPLSGEVAQGDVSEKMMPDGAGGWMIHRTEENHPDGERMLYDIVKQAGNEHAPADLCFRRYWQHDEDQGYLPYSARFIGFGEVE